MGLRAVEEVGWQNAVAKVEVFSRKRMWGSSGTVSCPLGLCSLSVFSKRGTGGEDEIL